MGEVRLVELPSILLAALATLGLGLVLGPEAPLIALGLGLARSSTGPKRYPTNGHIKVRKFHALGGGSAPCAPAPHGTALSEFGIAPRYRSVESRSLPLSVLCIPDPWPLPPDP